MKKYNFSAGPSILSQSVLKQTSESIISYGDMGLSIAEVSHRSPEIVALFDEAEELTKKLLGLSDNYKVLFLQGGASLQFYMAPLNLLKDGAKAAYIDTGAWSKKAVKEAKLVGEVDVLASSSDKNYNYIPKNVRVSSEYEYLHITSNNTIFGTQYRDFPQVSVPLIGDMSSDIFSRTFDASKFDLIYAGAQKNLGPAGATLVIVNEDKLGKTGRTLPSMLDYQVQIGSSSMYNTPPVVAVYMCLLTLRELNAKGGVEAIQKVNEQKAAKLYSEVDRNPLFTGTAEKEDRSMMNVTFVLKDDSHAAAFDAIQKEAGIMFLKGHRSVGGYRASIYNAMPESSIDVLIQAMQELENKI